MVAAYSHVLRAQRDVVLVVFLILIEGVVLIDVLDIGRGLVGGVVALGAALGVGRVALGVVDALVAFEYRGLGFVEIGAAEVVVVVIGRVGLDRVKHLGAHLCPCLLQKLLIGLKLALFLVAQTIEAHILERTASWRGGKGVGHVGLGGHLAPLRGHK